MILSVLCLIGLFGSISIYFNFIGLTFIGLSYIIIYIGAISILFLFIVMLIDIRISELQNENWDSMSLAFFIGLIFSYFIIPTGGFTFYIKALNNNAAELIYTLKTYFHNLLFVSSNNWDNNVIDISHISSIGSILYTAYSTWILLSSFVLLLAMFGAISVVMGNKDDNNAIKACL